MTETSYCSGSSSDNDGGQRRKFPERDWSLPVEHCRESVDDFYDGAFYGSYEEETTTSPPTTTTHHHYCLPLKHHPRYENGCWPISDSDGSFANASAWWNLYGHPDGRSDYGDGLYEEDDVHDQGQGQGQGQGHEVIDHLDDAFDRAALPPTSSSSSSAPAKSEASGKTTIATTLPSAPSSLFPSPPSSNQRHSIRGRRGDPRMHAAVAARLGDPTLPLLDALHRGGFAFIGLGEPGASDRSIRDEEGVQLYQRKNQLNRRLRLVRKDHAVKYQSRQRRKCVDKNDGGGGGGGDCDDNRNNRKKTRKTFGVDKAVMDDRNKSMKEEEEQDSRFTGLFGTVKMPPSPSAGAGKENPEEGLSATIGFPTAREQRDDDDDDDDGHHHHHHHHAKDDYCASPLSPSRHFHSHDYAHRSERRGRDGQGSPLTRTTPRRGQEGQCQHRSSPLLPTPARQVMPPSSAIRPRAARSPSLARHFRRDSFAKSLDAMILALPENIGEVEGDEDGDLDVRIYGN